MIYSKYIHVPNWQQHQKDLIDFYYSAGKYSPDMWWWCHFDDEVKLHMPNLIKDFASVGLQMHQLIYFTTPPKDITVTDHEDPLSIFIHQDAQDNPDYYTDLDTQFNPTFAVNIPLENCEGSTTFFYRRTDDEPEVYYPWHGCGGLKHSSVKEVHRFELNQPALLRINVPHGVFNPHAAHRTVATFRFYNNIDFLIKD